jgi:hypothetical protein
VRPDPRERAVMAPAHYLEAPEVIR